MKKHLVTFFFLLIALVCIGFSNSYANIKDSLINFGNFKNVISIAVSTSKVYAATPQGVIIYNNSQNKWELPLAGPENFDSVLMIQKIFVSQFDDQIIAETAEGLYEYDAIFGKWLPMSEMPELDGISKHISAPSILFPPFGFNYNGNGGFIDSQGRTFYISDIVDDGMGTLWIGTYGYGLARAGSLNKIVEWLPYGLLQSSTQVMFKKGPLLYFSGQVANNRRTGITIYNTIENSFEYIENSNTTGFPAMDIQCFEFFQNHLLIGTNQGLYMMNKKNDPFPNRLDSKKTFLSEDITSIKVVGDSVFVGTTKGLVLLTHQQDSATLIVPSELYEKTIFALDNIGTSLWIGTNAGAYRLSFETGQLSRFTDPDKVLFNRVFSIAHTNKHLWLASDGGVVSISIDSGKTTPYSVTSSRLWNRPIAVNDQIFAIASDHGLTLIFYNSDKLKYKEYSTLDGLISNTINCLEFDGDFLWIGTDKGVTRFWWANPDVTY